MNMLSMIYFVVSAMSKSEMKMSQDLCNSALTQNEEQLKALVESWNKATQQLELHVTEMVRLGYHKFSEI